MFSLSTRSASVIAFIGGQHVPSCRGGRRCPASIAKGYSTAADGGESPQRCVVGGLAGVVDLGEDRAIIHIASDERKQYIT